MDNFGVTEALYAILVVGWLLVVLYCAYLTAKKRHWLMFILGFFCGGIFWIVGAFLRDKRDDRYYS